MWLFICTTAWGQSGVTDKELLHQFQTALAAKDLAALAQCYDWRGVSGNMRNTTAMMLDELTRRDIKSVTLGRWSHKKEAVVKGVRYRPSQPPAGAIIVKYTDGQQADTLEIPYAKTEAGCRLVSIIEEVANPGAPKERRLAISVGGTITEQPAQFEGFYIAIINGKEVRQPFNGTVGLTKSLRGEYVKYCEIRKTAGGGAIYLLVAADGKTLFESPLVHTGEPITFSGGR